MTRNCFLFSLLLSISISLTQATSQTKLSELDQGLLWKFADIQLTSGEVYSGEIVGVYDESVFMWTPTEYTTISVFTCWDASIPFSQFSTTPGDQAAIFSLSNREIASISLVTAPEGAVEYRQYSRQHGHVFSEVPTEGEVWISTSWDKYHPWEDGRGNYAWDLGALNANMMSYSGYGTRNSDYEVFGKTVICPMYGRVVTVERDRVDNTPNITKAVEWDDHQSGLDVDLEQLPQNLVEVEIGGIGSPFLLRLIHQKRNTIPTNIKVGDWIYPGTALGENGNSGTTLVPHLHIVYGYTDSQGRYWSLPIDWKDMQHRVLLAYPTGYEYGPYHHHDYFYPKTGYLISK